MQSPAVKSPYHDYDNDGDIDDVESDESESHEDEDDLFVQNVTSRRSRKKSNIDIIGTLIENYGSPVPKRSTDTNREQQTEYEYKSPESIPFDLIIQMIMFYIIGNYLFIIWNFCS